MKASVKRFLTAVLILIAGSLAADAQTNVSGLISTNTTWTLAGSPYMVKGNTLVNNGVTLTIEPGVTVKFDTTKVLQVNGELLAIGTAQNRITFTAADSTPVRGSWGRIQFSTTSPDAVFDSVGDYESGSIMKYCDIKYGGGVTGDATVYCDTAALYFSNCRISECKKYALYFVSATGRVDSSSFRNGGGYAIYFSPPNAADMIAMNDTFENNSGGAGNAGSGTTGSFTNVTVKNCVFNNTGEGLLVTGSTNSVIDNNLFTGNAIAINLSSTSSSAITNNQFSANIDVLKGVVTGIATISDNVFIGNTHSVIGSPDCAIVAGTAHVPISTFRAAGIVISDNYFESNKGAILTSTSGYSIVQRNTFRSNQFLYVPSCSISGAYSLVRYFDGQGVIVNNIFDGNTAPSGNLIDLDDGTWEVANNVVSNNSSGNIYCEGTVTVCSNRLLGNSGSIIKNYGTVASAVIHNNEFINNGGTGAILDITNNSTVNNNEFRGNSSAGAVVAISNGLVNVYSNTFIDNLVSGNPIISVSNSNSSIHHNDFLNNTGMSCLSISGNKLPLVTQNNFVNPGIPYEVENLIPFGPGADLSLMDNYWGTTGFAHIDSVIKDYFDDGSLSVVFYIPVLASSAPEDTTNPQCFAGDAVALSGAILTESGLPVPGTTITLAGGFNQIVTTDTAGGYSFIVPKSGNYTITPSKNNDITPNNGISTADVLLIRRHTLGIAPLPSPYKIIAAAEANADGDTNVSTLDILRTRELILGNSTSFPTNRLWQFVSSDYVFPDASNPFPFDKTRTYTNITTNQTNQDFIGIKLGDVNGSWAP